MTEERWFLADLRTGRRIQDVRPISGSWKRVLNQPEDLGCVLDMQDSATIALDLRNSAPVGRTCLAVAIGEVIVAAGPVWAHDYSRDGATLQLSAKGALSYYDHRFILPVVARTLGLTQFTVPDPGEPSRTIPNPALTTSISGVDLGTVAKRLMEQAHLWTGGALPVVFPADRVGTHTRTYIGPEFKKVREAIKQLTEVEGGPDIRLVPRYTSDRLGVEFVLQTGTETEPLLASTAAHRWAPTMPGAAASNLAINVDGSVLSGLAWATGGRQDDEVLVARAVDDTLTGAGFPLFESLDSSHSSVSVQSTLDGYAAAAVSLGRRPFETWSFDAEADRFPFVGSYLEGDWCDLTIDPYQAAQPGVARRGDPYFMDGGTFRHRILAISGELGDPTVKVQCMPKVGI